MRIYRTQEVAEKLGISKQTLLRYEKKGILPLSRRNFINSWREYTQGDIEELKRKLKKGITIIELLMVIIIVGIISAAAIPRLKGLGTIKLNAAAKGLASDIRYVQQVAISRHTRTRMIFSVVSDTYIADEESPYLNNTWVRMKSPVTNGELSEDYRIDGPYSGIDISSASFSGSGNLTFNWTGAPSAGGTVTMSVAGGVRNVLVENETGLVRVQ